MKTPRLAVAAFAAFAFTAGAHVPDAAPRIAWHEVDDRVVEGREPQRFFEMKLQRVGDTDWPGGNPIPPR